MTLQQFQRLTAGLPAHTEIKVMDFFGNLGPAAIITAADLTDDDPARETFPQDALVITEHHELSDRDSLTNIQ